jgi:hypothetical protein
MEDIPGADTDDGVFDAPSPIEMEVYEGGAHDENPAQGDVDSRNVEQTPPHGHDIEHGSFDRSKNIYFLYFSLKDLYFIFIYSPSSSSIYFCSPPHLSGNISNVDEILGLFDSPPRAGDNADEPPREPRHTVAKRSASSISPSPHQFDVSSFFTPRLQSPLRV